MARERVDDKDLIEIDERQLAVLIARVLAKELGTLTREAINAALGRLD